MQDGRDGVVRDSDSLRDGQSGVQTLVWSRFSEPVLIGPEAHLVSCTMGTPSLSPG